MSAFGPRLACVAAAVLLLLGCSDGTRSAGDAGTHAPAVARRVKPRTVKVELFPVAERVISEGPDGELVWGALTDLEGVEVCLWKKRPMLGRFEDFVDVDGPCHTSRTDGSVPAFEALPASSELVFRWTKLGFEPLATHFVTYEQDFVPATAVNGARSPMLRLGKADPWLEPPGAPGKGDGVAAVYAIIHGNGPMTGGPQLGVAPFGAGVTPAQGIDVAIEPERGDATSALTRSDRPRWLVLPEGEYRVTFSHPRAACFWFAQQLQIPASGYPTDETGVVRMPVFAGHDVLVAADCHCDVVNDLGTPSDLASCSFAPDAGP